MGIYELSQPPPPVIASSCSSRSKPITYGQRAQRDSSSNVNKPFKSPLPPKAVLPSTSPVKPMTTILSPAASTSRPPSLTKSDAKSPVKENDNYDPDVEDWQDDMEVEDDESDGESDADLEQVVYVEARMTASTTVLPRVLLGNVLAFMQDYMENNPSLYLGPVDGWQDVRALASHLDAVNVSEIAGGRKSVTGTDVHFEVYVYRLWNDVDEYISGGTSDDEDEDERGPAAASTKQLPSGELDKLWENLIYPGDIKDRLLDYISSSCCFAEQAIDPRVVSHNRLILLHGPPGTGKTSLCRALAQKISIRLSAQYAETKLVEINSHSLFSKWFSESGKLVQKLFTHVTDMVDGESTFVVVMIDEVESLTAARSAGGSEPGDAMRVVNALLTQLDKLKTRKNVLVVTTSNLSHAIDPAFIDRADMKEYVPLPPPEAIYWMLRSCFTELMDKKIMKRLTLYDWVFANREYGKTKDRESAQHLTNGHVSKVNGSEKRSKDERSIELAAGLVKLATTCHGYKMSGRVLRRMPLMAHVRYLAGRQSTTIIARTPERWLEAMNKFVEDEQTDRAKIGWDKQDMATQ